MANYLNQNRTAVDNFHDYMIPATPPFSLYFSKNLPLSNIFKGIVLIWNIIFGRSCKKILDRNHTL